MLFRSTRNFQMARESDRRRLLRRCLDDWRLWCRAEGERRELLAQQEETRSKMAALISAAATGKLSMVPAACAPITVRPEPSVQSAASQEVSDPSCYLPSFTKHKKDRSVTFTRQDIPWCILF